MESAGFKVWIISQYYNHSIWLIIYKIYFKTIKANKKSFEKILMIVAVTLSHCSQNAAELYSMVNLLRL